MKLLFVGWVGGWAYVGGLISRGWLGMMSPCTVYHCRTILCMYGYGLPRCVFSRDIESVELLSTFKSIVFAFIVL